MLQGMMRAFKRCGRALLRSERGTTLAELALMVPAFTVILIGSAECARLAYAGIEVSNAAHAGAQYGSQTHGTASDTTGIQNVAKAAAPNVTGIQAVASTTCVCSNGTTITCSNAATACTARILEYVQVNTTATVTSTFKLPKLPASYTLKGVAIERVQQ